MDKIYIVMDYVEHDLKALMETMKQPFLEGKTSAFWNNQIFNPLFITDYCSSVWETRNM